MRLTVRAATAEDLCLRAPHPRALHQAAPCCVAGCRIECANQNLVARISPKYPRQNFDFAADRAFIGIRVQVRTQFSPEACILVKLSELQWPSDRAFLCRPVLVSLSRRTFAFLVWRRNGGWRSAELKHVHLYCNNTELNTRLCIKLPAMIRWIHIGELVILSPAPVRLVFGPACNWKSSHFFD